MGQISLKINKFKQDFKKTKFYIFNKKHKKAVLSISCITIILIALIVPFIDFGGHHNYDFSKSMNEYKNINANSNNITIKSEVNEVNSSFTSSNENDEKIYSLISKGDSVTYSFNVDVSDSYYLYFDYAFLSNGFKDSEFDIYIDENLTPAYTRTKLRANWQNDTQNFKEDSFGNQIVPTQQVVTDYINEGLYDYSFSTALPLPFKFESGEHKIKLTCTNGNLIKISTLYIKSVDKLPSYEVYSSKIGDKKEGVRLENDIQGENFTYKNDTSPIPTNLPDINAYPYDSIKTKLNTISNFNTSNQILDYEFEVKESGIYNINIFGEALNSNRTTFATIFIDGEIPFGELLHYPFYSTGDLEEYILKGLDNKPFDIYLEKGIHTISIKIDQSLTHEYSVLLEEMSNELNSIYLSLKKIAGSVSDNNKEWDPENDFPGVIEVLETIKSNLNNLIPSLKEINGSDANYEAIIYIRSAISSLEGILKKPKLIPNNYAKFSEGSDSIVQHLANAKESIENTPLQIDRIIIGTPSSHRILNKKGVFASFFESIKKFFLSFTVDYSSKRKDDKTLEIWVARSRQYVDLMQELIDKSDFKQRTGYDVEFTILSDESKLILSNAAKISPDGVMGISNWLPYEMGIRDLTVDLTKFEDYGDVIKRFSKGALISLIADGKGLALPETQDFYVTYYRNDIFAREGYNIPDTWVDVIELLPELQRNGTNYYIPLSTSTASKSIMTTAPFIYQYGGSLFSENGFKTTIDDEKSLEAIKLMTELYTLYGLEDQVSNFFNSFRNGSLPIGVSAFDTYVKLNLSAPELNGKWDIKVSPGVKDENGNIQRWQAGSAQAMCLIDQGEEKNKAGWELLKWWSSEEVQTEFSTNLTLLYGKGYIWNSANIDAFKNSIIFEDDEKEVILEQWEYMREIPRVPGWYMLERELSNSWNNIVLKAENTRAVIEDAVTVINKELERKFIEFGYLDNKGNIIKPYKVTTLESIQELIDGE